MEFSSFDIDGIFLITPRRFGDERGFFSETFRNDKFNEHVGAETFVQDNHSRSERKGTVRGLHFQKQPRAQGKLVRVTRGAIVDVAVDIRRGSPTHGRHVSVELSADNWRQLWIPAGFLHGFCTLEDDTEVIYKVTDYYSVEHDAGVLWSDPDIGVAWPVAAADAIVSEKDRNAPRLRDIGAMFDYAAA